MLRAGCQRSFAPHFVSFGDPRDESLIFSLVFGFNKTQYNTIEAVKMKQNIAKERIYDQTTNNMLNISSVSVSMMQFMHAGGYQSS